MWLVVDADIPDVAVDLLAASTKRAEAGIKLSCSQSVIRRDMLSHKERSCYKRSAVLVESPGSVLNNIMNPPKKGIVLQEIFRMPT